jgi:hypothetical protein
MTINVDDDWALILAILTAGIISWIVCTSVRKRKEIETIPDSVREGSHEAANEATKLQFHLREIANSPDPVRELMYRITRDR